MWEPSNRPAVVPGSSALESHSNPSLVRRSRRRDDGVEVAGPGDRGLGQGDPIASLFMGRERERQSERVERQELYKKRAAQRETLARTPINPQ